MSDTNCPYCGEPEETDTPTGITIYRCGTLIYPNGSSVKPLICDLGRDLRREREAHNRTKRERDEAIKQIHEEARDYELELRKLCEAYNDLAERNAKLKTYFIQKSDSAERERDEAREQNVKLRDIAEEMFFYVQHTVIQEKFRAELDQLTQLK